MTDASPCPACGANSAIPVGTLPLGHGGAIRTAISECSHCHTFWRAPPEEADLLSHLSNAGYTADARRDAMRAARRPLFMQVGRIAEGARGRWPTRPAVLDVGCAHGHLLDHFSEKGFSCTGVEPVARLRPHLEGRGIAVHARLDDVEPDRPFNLITFIDTLYYFDMPGAALARALTLLSRDGIIVVRITNRTPFLRLMRLWRDRPVFRRVFGDQLVALSHRGFLTMVQRAGGRLQTSYFYESRKFHGVADRLLYRGLGVAAALTRLPVSPGIVYVISRS